MGKDYTVLKIDELARVGDLHRIEKYYRYTIKTTKGTVITIDIDEKDSKPDKAVPILTTRANEIDGTVS